MPVLLLLLLAFQVSAAENPSPAEGVEGVGYLDLRHGEAGCTGTLIAPQWVLTAAHCLREATAPLVRFSLTHREGQPVQWVEADDLRTHPGFYRKLGDGTETDVGLVHLVTPLPANLVVPLDSRPAIEPDSPAISIGFGFDRHGVVGSKHANHVRANTKFPRGGKLSASSFFTAPGAEGDAACEGDSGGPLLQYVNHQRVVIGVWSSLLAKKTFLRKAAEAPSHEGARFLCQNVEAGIATSVAGVRDWLESNLGARHPAAVPAQKALSPLRLRGKK